MVRAVLDANVFVSAFLRPAGPPGEILRRWLEEAAFQVVLSPEILAEICATLFRPRVRARIDWPESEIERVLTRIEMVAERVEEPLEVRVAQDPDDDKYLAAALAGSAQLIVSGDRHLLELGEHEGIRIVTPRSFLDSLIRT